jgi:hypothetical protein
MTISKQALGAAMSTWVTQHASQSGFWLTLDAPYIDRRKPDAVQFEQTLGKFAVRLNSYCYGRLFKRREKRLDIMGSVEIGAFMDRPHAHLVVLHDTTMTRSFAEVELKSRALWYELTGARGDICGSLVDIQSVGDIESRLHYAVKRFNAQSDQYGRLVMY